MIKESDIYKTLWKCRDLEIQHYWHRMVFMTAFLLLCFAGYGGAFIGLVIEDVHSVPFAIANSILFFLSIVGIVVSVLWIMMSKGSKAWYEEYEAVIEEFQKQKKYMFRKNVREFATLDYDGIVGRSPLKLNDWLWNPKAGSYSVSRVGIALGHLSAAIWSILAIGHGYLNYHAFDWLSAESTLNDIFGTPGTMEFTGVIGLLVFWVYARTYLKSSYFTRHGRGA